MTLCSRNTMCEGECQDVAGSIVEELRWWNKHQTCWLRGVNINWDDKYSTCYNKTFNVIMSYLTYQWDTFRSSLQHPLPPWCPTWSPGLRTGRWCSGRSWWWGWSERPETPDRCRWSTATAPAWRPPGSDHSQRSSLGRSCDEPHPYSAGGSGCCGSGRPWPPGPGTGSGTSSTTQYTAKRF